MGKCPNCTKGYLVNGKQVNIVPAAEGAITTGHNRKAGEWGR